MDTGGLQGFFCEKLLETSPVSDPTLEQGKGVRSPHPEEEGAAETRDELTAAPIPFPLVLLRDRRWRNGGEVEPRRKGRVEGR